MAEHVADRNDKCKVCAIGAQAGNQVWPCSIWNAAKAAADVQRDAGGAAVSRRVWDMRVVYVQKQGRWWWNAWREQTSTELCGYADTELAAKIAMWQAVERAGLVDSSAPPCDPTGG